MPQRKGLLAPQNTFLDTIATRFDGTHSNFVLGNAQVHDYPIVYCSDGFVELTGYNRSQIMSKCCSCSFLWGEKTQEEAKQSILDTLKNKGELKIEIQFHKKTGEAFLCLLDIVPIKNDKSQVVLFLVSHKELSPDRHGRNKANCKVPESSLRLPYLLSAQHVTGVSLTNKSPNLLTMGLATTITAAALGSTGFRSNKMLDYLSTNKSKPQPKISHDLLDRNKPVVQNCSARSSIDSNNPSSKYPSPKDSTCRNSIDRSYMHQNDKIQTCSLNKNTPSNVVDIETGPLLTPEYNCFSNNNNSNSKSATSNKLMVPESDSSDSSTDDSSNTTDDPSTAFKFQRRRSRAVLYHLSGRFDQKSKHRLPFKKFQRISGKEAIPEYKVQDVQASRFILLHYSLFKIIWDWMILLCTFYIAIMVPYNAAFSEGGGEKDLIICDIIVELLFIIDIILNFWTTYVSKSGQVVYHLKAIAINYLRGWFFLDLLAAIPFEVTLAVNNPDIQGTIGEMGNWIHLLKLARLLRLARLFQKIERYSQYSTVILGLLMCMFFLVAHWFACGWYYIGKEESNSKITREYSWLHELGERMQLNLTYNPNNNKTNGLTRRALYVSSLYFTTTSLTSVGFGNVSPNTVNEKIFAVITMLVGALMHAAVFGNVTTLIQRMYSRRSAYQTKNQDLKDFTRAHHIPKPLKQRMLEFFQAMWAINRGIDKEAIMHSFPENLRGDIALHLNREILSLSLFKSASPGCRKSLAQLITTRFATPGEYVVNQGDVLRFIYFVCSGSLEILGEEGTVVGLLGKCDIFGSDMDDLPTLGFSAYNVKSLTYCELQCIALDHELQEIFEQYPQFQKQFALALSEELSFNLRAGFDPTSSMELIPAITLSNDKCMDSDEPSDNGSIKSQQTPKEMHTLLKPTNDTVSFENTDDNSSVKSDKQITEKDMKLKAVINSTNPEDLINKYIEQDKERIFGEKTINSQRSRPLLVKQNSLNLYPKHIQKSNKFHTKTFSLNKILPTERMNGEIDEDYNNNDNNSDGSNEDDEVNDCKDKQNFRENYSNFRMVNPSNSFQNIIDCTKNIIPKSFLQNKCRSFDDIYQIKKPFGAYSSEHAGEIKHGHRYNTTPNNDNNNIGNGYFYPEKTCAQVNDVVFFDVNHNNNNNCHNNEQLISLLDVHFHQTQSQIDLLKSEISQMNQKIDKIQKDFTEFAKYFIKESSSSNVITKFSDNKRLKTAHSVLDNENASALSSGFATPTTPSSTTTTQSGSCCCNSGNNNNNNNNSYTNNSCLHNSKDDLPIQKPIISSSSRPCLHQYGRPNYSPENRVVTFRLPPRNHDFRSQSLTNSRQMSPETPKANPFKRLLHKNPSISHID